MLEKLKAIFLIVAFLVSALELTRGLSAFVWGLRNEHVSSISRGWRVALNGVVAAGLSIALYLFWF